MTDTDPEFLRIIAQDLASLEDADRMRSIADRLEWMQLRLADAEMASAEPLPLSEADIDRIVAGAMARLKVSQPRCEPTPMTDPEKAALATALPCPFCGGTQG